ncbi:hypothetical protein ACP26L_30530 [Paenibacillus sp. S-38]|uniref:hypothetical protein n=1 Tax=Paenibacillus sp. S-38 TaxID=3416710 RepID=UPI003CE798E2
MSQSNDVICPWCQTEIVWDPEIGPEESCPHCFNELGEYRSINLQVKGTGQHIMFDDEEDEDFGLLDEEAETMDDYEEGVQSVLDTQEIAPECSSCRSFMLKVGTQPAPAGFRPFIHEVLAKPLVASSFTMDLYTCPSCFKLEQHLSEADRLAMIEQLKGSAKA